MNVSEELLFPLAYQGGKEVKLLGWNLPADQLHMVHSHWQTYEAPAFYMHLLLALMYFILMVLNVIGNGIVVWIFST